MKFTSTKPQAQIETFTARREMKVTSTKPQAQIEALSAISNINIWKY